MRRFAAGTSPVRGSTVTLDFSGKSGQRQHRELSDPRVARVVRALLKVPGPVVFKYVLDDGAVVNVRRRHINQYIKEVMGEQFSAKDSRTWAGTLICACALARASDELPENAPQSKTAIKRQVVAAVKQTAQELGNTAAVCRSAYIYPSVLSSFERGKVVRRYFADLNELLRFTRPGFHASEKALLSLLRENDQRASA